MLKQFYFKQFSLVLFDPWIEPYQVVSFRARVNLGVIVMKEHSTLPKASALPEPFHKIVWCHIQDTHWEVLPLCREAVSVFYRPS